MSLARVGPIADAILYEGYLLYPYRAGSLKNRERWMLGALHPRDYSEARGGLEPWSLQSECLVTGSADTGIEMAVRFLHPVSRTVEPVRAGGAEPPVESIQVGDRLLEAGQEAAAVEIEVAPVRLGALEREGLRRRFVQGPSRRAETVRSSAGPAAAMVVRAQERVEGSLEATAARVAGDTWRITVRLSNLTPLTGDTRARGPALLRSLASAHLVLGASGGSFVSLLDPPAALKAHAEACRNLGAWPVLVGAPGQRDTLLCSPIILEDYPRIAPESPGDLFDGTEIDEILTLRILTLTDDERTLMAAADERARALLARVDALGPEGLARLHGAVRERREDERPRSLMVAGAPLGPGDRVRLRPAGRGDVLDIALAGRAATIVSVEQDYEDRVYFTVTVDDDPGRDLGAEGKPGHRFFFGPDEVEAVILEPGGAVAAPPGPPARSADVKSAPLAAHADIGSAPRAATSRRVLVGGIGNVFLGDDAFGVEVVQRLRARPLPAGVDVVDFGIRGIDLAYALSDYDAAILIDAVPRGGPPGTLYVLEPEVEAGTEAVAMHSMTPARVLQWLPPGAAPPVVRIVGCEPATFGVEGLGEAGLSGPVRAALDEAVRLVEEQVAQLTVGAPLRA